MSDYVKQRLAQIQAEVLAEIAARPPEPLPKHVEPAPTGYVYFLRTGNAVKIGFSTNPGRRMKSIQTGCPEPARLVKVVRGRPWTEKKFHARFAEYRTGGEWFDLRGRLAKYLEGCIHSIDPPEPEVPAEIDFRL